MEILSAIIKLGVIIYESAHKFSFYLGRNIILAMDGADVPMMQILRNYVQLPDNMMIKGLGIGSILISLLIVKIIRRKIRRAKLKVKKRKSKEVYANALSKMAKGTSMEGTNFQDMNINDQRLLIDQMNSHMRMMQDHQELDNIIQGHDDFMDSMTQNQFIDESMNNCIDDAVNAATPEEFGGDAQPLFYDDDFGGFDDMGSGFDDMNNGFDDMNNGFNDMGGGGFDGF